MPSKDTLSKFGLLCGILLCVFIRSASAEPKPLPPEPSQLEAGDFIWPKTPNVPVPYSSHPGASADSEAERWTKERDAHLKTLRDRPELSTEEQDRYKALSSMTYNDFSSQYLGDLSPDTPQNFSSGIVYVGHVGIIQVIDGKRFVVEAVLGKGVRRIAYDQWLAERPDDIFWVGRLKETSAEVRASIAKFAAGEIGKPYNFWNFDLHDDRGFYCSKLAWLSIWTAAKLAADDNPDPKRSLWLSPKQLMRSRHLEILVNPGDYGLR